jgi:hypothetical protein
VKLQGCVATHRCRHERVGVELKEWYQRCRDAWVHSALFTFGRDHDERCLDHNLELIELQTSLTIDSYEVEVTTAKPMEQLGSRRRTASLID